MSIINNFRAAVSMGGLILASLFSNPVDAQTKVTQFSVVTGKIPNDTLQVSIKDLQSYIAKSVPRSKTNLVIAGTAASLKGTVIVLVDEKDMDIKQLAKNYGLTKPLNEWNSFEIRSFKQKDNPANLIYFLQGADAMGKQYAIYDLAERLLGIKYLRPDLEQIPLHKNFKPIAVNTGLQKPDYKWRGLYPWNYNYNERGLTTFCDINARFENKDWAWYRQLGDWMIKNKQNAFLWFDDVFAHENISGQFPDSLTDYYASRGIKQVLGLGWASNEDLTTGGDWKRKICLDEKGKSVEDASWKCSICPQAKEYFQLADTNFANMKLNKPNNYIGALIGYGENTWASKEKGVNCVLHSGVPSSTMMIRDLKYVSDKLKSVGLGNLPVGFVTSTHSMHAGNPFVTDNLINNLPKNTIFSMHTYQQSGWKQSEELYKKINERNEKENAEIKAFQIAEVAFLCGTDIPLVKPSILRRRSEHYSTLPKENTLGHLATLNTTQYLYWYNTYQLLKWQWHKDDKKWNEDNLENFTSFFGNKNGAKLNEIYNRLTCLEYVLPYTSLDSLVNTKSDLRPPVQWGRYNQKTHPNDYGFLLWAEVKSIKWLEDAEKSIATIQKVNNELNKSTDEKYKSQFYATIRLTGHYYAIRVQTGKYQYYFDAAKAMQKSNGWNTEVEKLLLLSRLASQAASENLAHYNEQLVPLLGFKESNKKANTRDLGTDFVQNPKPEYFTKQVSTVESVLKNKSFLNP